MKLIEFLLHNWYLAFVAFFLLGSLLKRTKNGSGTRPRREMPPFGGGGGWGGEQAPTISTAKQASGGNGRFPAKGTVPKLKTGQAAEPSARTAVWEDREILDYPAGNRSSNREENAFRTAPSPSQQERTEREQLAQGIIWAEILGPPRAKKPFRKK